MEKARITVAVHNMQAAEKIKYALQRSGYSVTDICTSGNEALRRIRSGVPDILLINFDMPDTTGLEVATIVGDENLCSVILFITSTQKDFCIDLVEDYDITLFVKPINRIALLSTIEAVLQNRRRISKLEKELSQLKQGLADRKAIERAKGILMKRKSISEAEAYRRIQKMSMDSRVAMRDIAEKIIELA
ncbi:MAG: ANTAR domain-containing protein [Eubacteriales bacterium]|nr:ANTAR domain-containing protein [Eubacteriales bacterium]